jgi:Mg2+-importing ATPase
MFIFGPISSFYDFLTFFILYVLFKFTNGSFQTGWFMESLASQTLVIFFIRTRKIPFIQSSPSLMLFISSISVVFLGWLLPYFPLGRYFGMTPLPLYAMMSLVMVVLAYLCTIQIGKSIFYRRIKSW